MNSVFNIAAMALVGASMVAADGAPCTSLADAISEAGLTKLSDAVLSVLGDEGAAALAGLATATVDLPDSEKVTIFAPEDDAWPTDEGALPTGGDLLDALFGHVIPSYLPAESILEALSGGEDVPLESLSGAMVTASMEGESIFVATEGQMEPAMVIETDIETCAGVIHVVDALLVPGGMAPAMAPAEGPMMMGPAMAPGPVAEGPLADSPFAEGPLTDDIGDRGLEGEIEEGDADSASRLVVGTVVAAVAGLALLL